MTEDGGDSDEGEGGDESNTRITVGTHRGYEVHIAAWSNPEDAEAPEEFGVNLYIPNSTGENVDIARIDTEHSGCHIDRFYLPEDHGQYQHDYGLTVYSPEGGIRYFLEENRWREFVDRYDENHGLPNQDFGEA